MAKKQFMQWFTVGFMCLILAAVCHPVVSMPYDSSSIDDDDKAVLDARTQLLWDLVKLEKKYALEDILFSDSTAVSSGENSVAGSGIQKKLCPAGYFTNPFVGCKKKIGRGRGRR